MKTTNLERWICESEDLPVLSRRAIKELQLDKLNALLERERKRNGFYKGLPPKLYSLGSLSALPFTTPRQLAEKGGAMVLASQADIDRVVTDSTSGTSGHAKRVYYSGADCANTVGFFSAGLSELVYPGDRVLICMPFSGPRGLGDMIASAVVRLGAEPIKAGVGATYAELRDIIETKEPDAFVGMPVPLLSLLRLCGPMSLRRALISGDACTKKVVSAIEGLLGSRVFPHYGSREMVLGGAVTCPAHHGMHLRENHIIAEIIGENDMPVPDGEWGELVITTIGMEALPLIRYRTGDRTRIIPEPCPCGGTTLRLDTVRRMNRAADPAALDDEIFALPNVVDCSLSMRGGALQISALTLNGGGGDEIAQAAKKALPAKEISVRTRAAHVEDAPMYQGKRFIRG